LNDILGRCPRLVCQPQKGAKQRQAYFRTTLMLYELSVCCTRTIFWQSLQNDAGFKNQ